MTYSLRFLALSSSDAVLSASPEGKTRVKTIVCGNPEFVLPLQPKIITFDVANSDRVF